MVSVQQVRAGIGRSDQTPGRSLLDAQILNLPRTLRGGSRSQANLVCKVYQYRSVHVCQGHAVDGGLHRSDLI